MNKIIGYIISIIGISLLGISMFPKIKAKLPQFSGINNLILMIIGIMIVLIGIFLISKSKGDSKIKNKTEVPIYEGKKIVGFRRN